MTRQEHLEWCKKRALEYVAADQIYNAYASMISDLGKHPELAGHPAIMLGVQLMAMGELSTQSQMRKFIDGFN